MATLLAAGCDDGGAALDDVVDLGDETRPRIEAVQLTRLVLTSDGEPAMLHPVQVELGLEVSGDAFDTDVLVGLRADGGELGCVLGALPVGQGEAGTSQVSGRAEYFVSGDCRDLVGRDDVELFAAFDPWGQVEVEREGTAAEQPTELYDIVRGSMLGTEGCDECRTGTVVLDSPGLDAQLREVALDSSVAVLVVPDAEDQERMPEVDAPQFQISSAVRVTGLPKGQAPRDGEVSMTYRIRPLAGAPGTEGIGDEELDWEQLLERRRDEAGEVVYQESARLDARGQVALQRASAVYVGPQLAARMTSGDWQDVEEFELMTCVETDIPQAVYEGESAPRSNDCASLSVVVVRRGVGPNGERDLQGDDALAGAAKARSAEVWGTGWSTTNTFLGTDYDSGISFETWLDINASDSATTTYGGRSVDEAGSWFEAGAYSGAEVFNNEVTLLDAFVTLIGYDAGGGEVEMQVQAMGFDVVDAVSMSTTEGLTLTLEDVLDLAGVSTTTTWSDELTLYGYSFDDGCGTVSAGIFLEGEIGIDNQATNVTVTSAGGGVTVTGDVVPMAGVTAVSRAEAAYSGFLSINVALTINLEIFTITFPFHAEITYTPGTPATLDFLESVSLGLSTLSGSIDFSFDYEFWCMDFDDWTCSDDHSHTLVSWDGISDSWTLFDWTQTLQFGPGASFCGNFDGQLITLYNANRDRYVEGSPFTPFPVQSTQRSPFTRFLVQCDGEQVALRRFDGFYVNAPADLSVGYAMAPDVSNLPDTALYTPISQSDGTWVFQSDGGKYVTARGSNVGWILEQKGWIGSSMKFQVVPD